MAAFWTVFCRVLLFSAFLIPGLVLGKGKLLQDCAMVSFSNVLMYVAMPFLVFSKLLDLDLRQVCLSEILLAALMPILLSGLLILVCRLFCREEPTKRRAAVFCAVFPNCGFLGIPLAAILWPQDPKIVFYLSVFNVVSTFLLLTVGVWILSGDQSEICLKKTLVSPIFFAIVLGVAASLLGTAEVFPSLRTFSDTLANLTTPLAMITLGFELSKLPLRTVWRQGGVYRVSLVRLILSPLLALGVLMGAGRVFSLPMSRSLVLAVLVATSVSTAASAPAMAKKYGADSVYAAALTVSNTLLCTLTLPLAYLAFEWLLF